MQWTARQLDNFGISARSTDPFLPNAPILRTAEAIDAVANAARSATKDDPAEAAGLVLCTIVELGGILYVLFIIVVAIVLLAFLPCVNFLFQLCFDTSVAVATAGRVRPNTRASGGGAVAKALLTRAQSAGAATEKNFNEPARQAARNAKQAVRDAPGNVVSAAKAAPEKARAKVNEAQAAAGRAASSIESGVYKARDDARASAEAAKAKAIAKAQAAQAGARARAQAVQNRAQRTQQRVQSTTDYLRFGKKGRTTRADTGSTFDAMNEEFEYDDELLSPQARRMLMQRRRGETASVGAVAGAIGGALDMARRLWRFGAPEIDEDADTGTEPTGDMLEDDEEETLSNVVQQQAGREHGEAFARLVEKVGMS